jgi:hypothetical protein
VVNGVTKIFRKVINEVDQVPFLKIYLPEKNVLGVTSVIHKDGNNSGSNPTTDEFISNKNNFSNSIFQANKWTPMQTIVNALGSYEYEDPMGGGKLMIEKDPSGLSDYMVNVSFRELMPDGSIKYTTTEVPSVNYQNNIDYAAQIALPYLQKQVEANTSVWNTYMSKGFAPGVSIESPESKLNQ